MPTTTMAWSLAEAVTALIDTATTTATVHAAWPGDKHIKPEMIWLENLAAEVVIPTSKAGRVQRDEVITFDVRIVRQAKTTTDLAMTRVAELLAQVCGVFANDPSLATAGVVLAEVTAYELAPAVTPEGVFATGSVSVSVRTRLT